MKTEPQHYANPAGWTIVTYGMLLCFITAFRPYFEAGYVFELELLLVGLLPYLIYGIALPLLRSALTTTAGILMTLIHTTAVVAVRFFNASDNLMYSVPVVLAALMIPLVIVALIKSDVHHPGRRIIRH